MDFASLSALTTPDLHTVPSPSYQTPIFSNPSTTSQHTSPTTSTPPSTEPPKEPASRKRARDASDGDDDAAIKRHRNTLAARKYRQKRLDRIKELEDALEDVTRDRDDLRIRLARQEAETEALKTMMKMRVEK